MSTAAGPAAATVRTQHRQLVEMVALLTEKLSGKEDMQDLPPLAAKTELVETEDTVAVTLPCGFSAPPVSTPQHESAVFEAVGNSHGFAGSQPEPASALAATAEHAAPRPARPGQQAEWDPYMGAPAVSVADENEAACAHAGGDAVEATDTSVTGVGDPVADAPITVSSTLAAVQGVLSRLDAEARAHFGNAQDQGSPCTPSQAGPGSPIEEEDTEPSEPGGAQEEVQRKQVPPPAYPDQPTAWHTQWLSGYQQQPQAQQPPQPPQPQLPPQHLQPHQLPQQLPQQQMPVQISAQPHLQQVHLQQVQLQQVPLQQAYLQQQQQQQLPLQRGQLPLAAQPLQSVHLGASAATVTSSPTGGPQVLLSAGQGLQHGAGQAPFAAVPADLRLQYWAQASKQAAAAPANSGLLQTPLVYTAPAPQMPVQQMPLGAVPGLLAQSVAQAPSLVEGLRPGGVAVASARGAALASPSCDEGGRVPASPQNLAAYEALLLGAHPPHPQALPKKRPLLPPPSPAGLAATEDAANPWQTQRRRRRLDPDADPRAGS